MYFTEIAATQKMGVHPRQRGLLALFRQSDPLFVSSCTRCPPAHSSSRNSRKLLDNSKGVEYWMARDIQELLEYDKWDNFLNVLEKAKMACQNSGHALKDHFADVRKMIP